ncbi:MAG: PTS sugar transporter subunit IIC [Aerococcus sp.]|nr:PTS sugar transporter subunit IIC [Aerococcus sp.]
MEFQWWQILILSLYSGYQILDELQVYSAMSSPVFAGLVTGLVMGDMVTGLKIGAAMQLMVLGVGTFGGSSKIDANSGTILATAFSVSVGMSAEQAVGTIGVAVATLMLQLDVLARMANTFFQHRIDSAIEHDDYRGIERNFLLGALSWSLSRLIPIFLALAFGAPIVQSIVDYLNGPLEWLGNGLSLAGSVMPAVGFAILLRYLPVKKHVPYLILGFVITALFTTIFGDMQAIGTGLTEVNKEFATILNGLPMLAIALIGFAFALIRFREHTVLNAAQQVAPKQNQAEDTEGEIEDDEI